MMANVTMTPIVQAPTIIIVAPLLFWPFETNANRPTKKPYGGITMEKMMSKTVAFRNSAGAV